MSADKILERQIQEFQIFFNDSQIIYQHATDIVELQLYEDVTHMEINYLQQKVQRRQDITLELIEENPTFLDLSKKVIQHNEIIVAK